MLGILRAPFQSSNLTTTIHGPPHLEINSCKSALIHQVTCSLGLVLLNHRDVVPNPRRTNQVYRVLFGRANNSGAIAQVIQLANGVRQTLQYYYRVSAYYGVDWSCDFTSIYNTDQSQVTVTLNNTQTGPDFRSETATFYPMGNGVGQLFFLLLCENSPNNYGLDVILDNFSVVAG
jgi:hypothetical protein